MSARPLVPPLARRALLAATAALAGCSVVPQAAYVQRTVWPLTVRRKVALPPRRGGKVLVVRDLTAGPGLDQRGVQWLRPNGSLHVDYYNQWAVPPAEGVTDDLRRWLADSGLFAAVVGPDSGLAGDLVLEGELTALLGDPARNRRGWRWRWCWSGRGGAAQVLMQRTTAVQAPMTADTPAAIAASLLTGLGAGGRGPCAGPGGGCCPAFCEGLKQVAAPEGAATIEHQPNPVSGALEAHHPDAEQAASEQDQRCGLRHRHRGCVAERVLDGDTNLSGVGRGASAVPIPAAR